MIKMVLYFCFVQVTLLLPGYVLLKKTKYFRRNPGVELSLAYVASLVFFATLATADYALKLSPGFSRLICWLVIIGSLVEFLRAGYFRDLIKLRFPLLCLIGLSLLANLFLSLTYSPKYNMVPDPQPRTGTNYHVLNVKVLNIAKTQANDNYIPYRQAQFFVNRSDPAKDSFIGEWGVDFFERSPFMGAVTANYFNLFNDKPPIGLSWDASSQDPGRTYQKFQIIANILNSLLVIPGFFLLAKLFNRKTALVTSLFLITSQFFLYNDIFSWPKSFVAFFILISWLLLLEKKPSYTLAAGIVSGIAYLTHDLAVLYIGASFVFLLINKRFRELLFFTIPLAILAAPWIILADIVYHKPSTFIYYPLSTKGIPQLKEEPQIIHQFWHTSPLKILSIRLSNLLYLLSPFQLFTSEGGQSTATRLWASGLFSITGAVGFGLLIPAYLEVFKRIKSWLVWVFVLLPVILSTLVIGWPKGLAALHFAEAVVVLLSGLAVFYLLNVKDKRWLMAAYLLNVIELVFFTIYSYSYAAGVWFGNVRDLISLLIMIGLVTAAGWLIHQIIYNKKTWLTS